MTSEQFLREEKEEELRMMFYSFLEEKYNITREMIISYYDSKSELKDI